MSRFTPKETDLAACRRKLREHEQAIDWLWGRLPTVSTPSPRGVSPGVVAAIEAGRVRALK